MATMKSSLTTKVPSPKNQGGHGSSEAVTQKTSIQSAPSVKSTGTSDIKYTVQPSGIRGSNPGAK
jgi:hypothetical protein